MIYRVLSVQQPWATLIIRGHKDVENRTWKTPYRGRIAIHASSKFDYSFFDFEDDPDEPLGVYCQAVRDYFGILPGKKKITRNTDKQCAILGTVKLDDCIVADETSPEVDSPWCFYCGYAWMLSKPEEFKKPIAGVNGKLNLWTYNTEQSQKMPLLFK